MYMFLELSNRGRTLGFGGRPHIQRTCLAVRARLPMLRDATRHQPHRITSGSNNASILGRKESCLKDFVQI
jgi:hypothetical protein